MKKFVLVIFVLSSVMFSQSLKIFPGELNIDPYTANTIEPKLGFMFKNSGNELRLDIGNTIDIARLETTSGDFSFGADLFTWTLLRKQENFHFPVDAVDYLFGLNFGYKKSFPDYSYGTRIRLSHISAHLVDGHYDKTNMVWLNNQLPRVYSREFIEMMPFYELSDLRMYLGFTYLYHVDPEVDCRTQYQAGFEYFKKDFICNNLSPFVAYDARLTNGFSQSPNHSINAGVKFGTPYGRGVRLYFNYYSGMNIHGEYYDFKEEYSGIGLNLDL
jgi:hypothetical protein